MAIEETASQPRILVAGCGALGGRIATLLARDATVFGLRRQANKVPAGVEPVAADLLQPTQLRQVLPSDLDAVIYCLTPSQYSDQGYRDAYVTGLNNLLDALDGQRPQRLIFISSTSVYHQDDDSWVDEHSATEPARFSGQCILEGEQRARDSRIPATVVRLSGIYGPSRRRFLTAVQDGGMNPRSPGPYSNRIHEEDAARAVVHLLELALSGNDVAPTYLVSDCEPVRLDEVVRWVQDQVPCRTPGDDARTGGRAGSKRCRNQRLLATGFRFQYPDFRVGYGEMIAQEKPDDAG